jgi:RNA ligase (TIGR02306 family)
MSDHSVPVVPLVIARLTDTEKLGTVAVGGYTVVVNVEDWAGCDRAAFVRPDLVYAGKRVTPRRFAGHLSQGMLVPAPEGAQVGDDVAEALGVTNYVPPEALKTSGQSAVPPTLYTPTYDVERLQIRGDLYPDKEQAAFLPGEDVVVTEKLDGSNVRAMVVGGVLHVGSHKRWVRDEPQQVHWKAVRSVPQIEEFLRRNPGLCLYGEGYGWVSRLRYGTQQGEISFAAFDLYDTAIMQFLDFEDACERLSKALIPTVPILGRYPYTESTLVGLADGPSLVVNAHHQREGIVLRTPFERVNARGERALRKVISSVYLSHKGKEVAA